MTLLLPWDDLILDNSAPCSKDLILDRVRGEANEPPQYTIFCTAKVCLVVTIENVFFTSFTHTPSHIGIFLLFVCPIYLYHVALSLAWYVVRQEPTPETSLEVIREEHMTFVSSF